MAKDRVERKIYFFRFTSQAADPLDPTPILAHIQQLPNGPNGRHWEDSQGNAMCCWVDSTAPRQKLRLGKVRRTDLPHMEDGGHLSPLPFTESAGLCEQTHFVFFENGIIGAEFNYAGPRASQLVQYVRAKAAQHSPRFEIHSLIRNDVMDQLLRLGSIKLMDLKIDTSYLKALPLADEYLRASFEASHNLLGTKDVEVIIRPKKEERVKAKDRLLLIAKVLFNHPSFAEMVRKFKVEGDDAVTESTANVDLLSDKVIATKSILKIDERHRVLKSEDVYIAIENAYDDLKDEIQKAAGVEL